MEPKGGGGEVGVPPRCVTSGACVSEIKLVAVPLKKRVCGCVRLRHNAPLSTARISLLWRRLHHRLRLFLE